MSIENAKAFYSRITTDEVFRTQLQNAASEERTAIIQAAGYHFTPEEWSTATAQVLAAERADKELNNAELEAVAGGIGLTPGFMPANGTGLPPDLDWLLKGPDIPPLPGPWTSPSK